VLKPLTTLAGLMSYSQLLYCEAFIYGYDTKTTCNNIHYLNNSLTKDVLIDLVRECFTQC